MARDDFPTQVKDRLAKRVGVRCSNPNCRRPTAGPRSDGELAVNMGVAAHITAASEGGPRFDPSLSAGDRAGFGNGIWLCQNCAKLIDSDPALYTEELLRAWKRLSEEAARLELDRPASSSDTFQSDRELIGFFTQCFDRPAFQDPFRQEGCMEAFDRAIEDTIIALNTGCLRSRRGGRLAKGRGKSYLENRRWAEKLDVVVDLLQAIRSRYRSAIREGAIQVHERSGADSFYVIHDYELAEWMDRTRTQIVQEFAEVSREAGLRPPRGLRPRHW